MRKYISLVFTVFTLYDISAQEIAKDTLKIDTNYREDQFYTGITYDLLVNKPEEVTQQNFSRGFHLGVLRDMPFNEKRTLAVAAGLGYSYSLIYSNILSIRDNKETFYYIGDLKKNDVSKSYFDTHSIEIPIEFRWRNSTSDSHKFWRVYTGIKVSYVYSQRSLFIRDGLSISFKNSDIANRWQFKAYTAFGYNTWNFLFSILSYRYMKDRKQ